MGNLFSRGSEQQQAEIRITQLEEKLKNIQSLDANNDGFVSKKEFDSWFQRQTDDLKLFKEQLIQIKDREYQQQMSDYQKQISSLTELNQKLEAKMRQQQTSDIGFPETTIGAFEPVNQLSRMSKVRVNEMIEKLLANENVNIKYLPDFVERQMYRNMFNITLGLIDEILSETKIRLLGHEITMTLAPQEKSSFSNSDTANSIESLEEVHGEN